MAFQVPDEVGGDGGGFEGLGRVVVCKVVEPGEWFLIKVTSFRSRCFTARATHVLCEYTNLGDVC